MAIMVTCTIMVRRVDKSGGRRATLRAAVLLATAAATASAVAATDRDYSLRMKAGYTDNINRTPTDEQSAEMYAVGGTLDYTQKTARLDANAHGDLDYVWYTQESVDDQLVGNFMGELIYGIVPEQFLWFATENFGQGRLDEFQPSGPDNQQAINAFSTGPQAYFKLDERLVIFAEGAFSNVWYQDSDADNNQYRGDVALIRALSTNSNVQLGLGYQRIDYDDPDFSPNIDVASVALGYRSESERSMLSVDAGYQHLDDGESPGNAPLLRLEYRHRASAYSSVVLDAGYMYNDGAGLLGLDQGLPGADASPGRYNTGAVFEDAYAGLGWNLNRARTRLFAGIRYHDQSYVQNDQPDVNRLDLSAGASRDLSREWTIGTSVNYWKEDYSGSGFKTNETDLEVFAAWEFSRTLQLRASWDFWQRGVNGPTQDSSENRYWLTAQWSPTAGRPSRVQDSRSKSLQRPQQ